MFYLSDVINKKLYSENRVQGKVIDLVVSDAGRNPAVTQLVVKKKGKKTFVDAEYVGFSENAWKTKKRLHHTPYSDTVFFLSEDLLEKQVIDINGKRLVRVNDVILKENGQLKAEGIDIGFAEIGRAHV